MLPLGMCWQLQDGPDYHLSWGRGQGRLRRCGGVLWAFKRRKCVEIAKRALLAHLGLEHAGCFVLTILYLLEIYLNKKWLLKMDGSG